MFLKWHVFVLNTKESKSPYIYKKLLSLADTYTFDLTIFSFPIYHLPPHYHMVEELKNKIQSKGCKFDALPLAREYPVQLMFDPTIWDEFAKSDADYIMYIKSTISAFPDNIFNTTEDIILAPCEDRKNTKEFISFNRSLLDGYLVLNKIDRDQPMNEFMKYVTNQKTPITQFITIALDDTLQEFPLWLYIEVCTKCNLACEYCPQKYADDRTSVMSPEVFENTLKKFMEITTIKGVNLIGLGELMMHPNPADILKVIEKYGLAVCFTTNGTIWRKDVYEALPPNSTVYFSLDGVTDVPRDMRKVDPQVVIGTIRKLRALRPNINIVIQPVLVKGFLKEALPYAKLARELNVNIHPTVPVLGNKKDFDKLFPDDNETESSDIIMKTVTRCDNNLYVKPQYRTCFDPFHLLLVTIDGNVYPCCYINTVRTNKSECFGDYEYKLNTDEFILGNIFKDDVETIVNNPKLMKIRENVCNTAISDFSDRKKIDIQKEPLNYCKICLARWKKGC